MLERWFLKSLINLYLVQDDSPRWPGDVRQFAPPLWMVRTAYGSESLAKPMGLYSVAYVGEQTAHRDGVEFGPLFTKADVLVGGVFKFVGYRFLLSLFPGELPKELACTSDPKNDWFRGEPFYHVRRWNHDVGGRRSHFVDINWPGAVSDHFAA